MFGIRINKAKNKIEKKLKNCYVLGIPYRGIEKAAGIKKSFFANEKLVNDYLENTMHKLGYKKASKKAGASFGCYKQGKDCIYAIDWLFMDGSITVYIRCLQDTEGNKEVLAGGKKYL